MQLRATAGIQSTALPRFSVFCDSHRFCQVAWLIHVEATQYSQVVAEELQGYNIDDRLQAISQLGYLQVEQRTDTHTGSNC